MCVKLLFCSWQAAKWFLECHSYSHRLGLFMKFLKKCLFYTDTTMSILCEFVHKNCGISEFIPEHLHTYLLFVTFGYSTNYIVMSPKKIEYYDHFWSYSLDKESGSRDCRIVYHNICPCIGLCGSSRRFKIWWN